MTTSTLQNSAAPPETEATRDSSPLHLRADRDDGLRTSPSSTVAEETSEGARRDDDKLQVRTANVCLMRLLEKVATEFNRAGIPLMALKGAALNMTIYDRLDERPMSDLDLLIRPEHVEVAFALLESAGCLRGQSLVREDFFPRFHYETEFNAGHIFHMRIDLHVRPFRPLRWGRLNPTEAMWARAEPMQIGRAQVLIPSVEDMLVHLAAHSALHGNCRPMWLADIKRWADARRSEICWEQFLIAVRAGGLALPVREAIEAAEHGLGEVCPPSIRRRLARIGVGWRDRLALWQAPRDAYHPVAHVAVDTLCTPGWRFRLGYLCAVLVPDRGHMQEWYCRNHWGWLACAHLLRLLGPITRRLPKLGAWFSKIETRKSPIHGIGVFATRDIKAGEVVACYRGRSVDQCGLYVACHETPSGHIRHYEITGRLKHLNHSDRPNAELRGFELIALRPVRAGQEFTIRYREYSGECPRAPRPTDNQSVCKARGAAA